LVIPTPPLDQVRAIGIAHPGDPVDLVLGDPGRGQGRVEAVGGMREVGLDRGRPQPRVDADEQQLQLRPDEIRNLVTPERLQLLPRETHLQR
jgi:hypothetical protein